MTNVQNNNLNGYSKVESANKTNPNQDDVAKIKKEQEDKVKNFISQ